MVACAPIEQGTLFRSVVADACNAIGLFIDQSKLSDFKKEALLGSGSFGRVFMVRRAGRNLVSGG